VKDARIFQFKLRAEKDNCISNGARALILRICTWRYGVKYHPADAEFALSWREMAAWFGIGEIASVKHKDTIYRWLRELVLNQYLHYNGLKGSPATACYRLTFHTPKPDWLFDWASSRGAIIWTSVGGKNSQLDGGKNSQLDGGKNSQLVGGNNHQPVGGKNQPPHIGYFPSGRKVNTTGKKIEARSARERRGEDEMASLRSGETKEEIDCSLRSKRRPGESLEDFMTRCKTESGLTSS
jgi:hypothetical protein